MSSPRDYRVSVRAPRPQVGVRLSGGIGPQGPPGTPGAPGQPGEGFRWRGSWDRESTYERNDVVLAEDGALYVALIDPGDVEPGGGLLSLLKWGLFLPAGPEGPPGSGGISVYRSVTGNFTPDTTGDHPFPSLQDAPGYWTYNRDEPWINGVQIERAGLYTFSAAALGWSLAGDPSLRLTLSVEAITGDSNDQPVEIESRSDESPARGFLHWTGWLPVTAGRWGGFHPNFRMRVGSTGQRINYTATIAYLG